jgi:uncharacterized lipoprotein YddW (UPF0748 family)
MSNAFSQQTVANPSQTSVTPQVRGFWVDGFNPGIKSRAEVDQLIARVQQANCNAIFAQVRKRGDAYYWSRYEPRARDFQNIAYDPLAYLIEKAHAATPRISVHAWINMGAVGNAFDPAHILAKHPDWRSISDTGEGDDKEAIKIDPGVPGAADWTFRVYLDVLRQYDVDGIHFDFVRYGDAKWGYAPESVARFNRTYQKEGKPSFDNLLWQDWRREQVTNLVRKVYVHAAEVKPQAIVSAATITWGDGPQSEAEWRNSAAFSRVYQDWRGWLEEGILDLACPMTYFRQDPHRSFQENWANWIKSHQYQRAATLAVAAYLNNQASTLELARINLASTADGKTPAGLLFYCYNAPSVRPEEKEAFFANLTALFPEAVPFPTFGWKQSPQTGHIKGFVHGGTELKPIDGATVVIRALSPPRTGTRRTDSTGFFAFANLSPGTYEVVVEYDGEISTARKISVTAGEVETAHFRLSDGDLPLPRLVQGLGTLSEGAKVFLESRHVTVGTSGLGGNRCYIADAPGEPAVEVRFSQELPLPFVPGDQITLTATIQREGNRVILQAESAVFVGIQKQSSR